MKHSDTCMMWTIKDLFRDFEEHLAAARVGSSAEHTRAVLIAIGEHLRTNQALPDEARAWRLTNTRARAEQQVVLLATAAEHLRPQRSVWSIERLARERDWMESARVAFRWACLPHDFEPIDLPGWRDLTATLRTIDEMLEQHADDDTLAQFAKSLVDAQDPANWMARIGVHPSLQAPVPTKRSGPTRRTGRRGREGDPPSVTEVQKYLRGGRVDAVEKRVASDAGFAALLELLSTRSGRRPTSAGSRRAVAPPPPVRGQLRREIERPRTSPLERARAVGQLLHNYCMDEVDTFWLDHEPGTTCACDECAAVYISAKSGALLRVGLLARSGDDVPRASLSMRGSVSALYHLHPPASILPPGNEGSALLVAGTEDGVISFIADRRGEFDLLWSVHLERWASAQQFERARGEMPPPMPGLGALLHEATGYSPMDRITAIIGLESGYDPPSGEKVSVLVASRRGSLHLLHIERDEVSICSVPLQVRGYVALLFRTTGGVCCVSSEGDLIEIPDAALRGSGPAVGDLPRHRLLNTPPAVAAPIQLAQGPHILVAGERGLSIYDMSLETCSRREAQLPLVWAHVRALAVTELFDRRYVITSAPGGRITFCEVNRLTAELEGSVVGMPPGRRFSFQLGQAVQRYHGEVLSIQVLRIKTEPGTGKRSRRSASCFLVAALSDRSVRLLRIEDYDAHCAQAAALWQKLDHLGPLWSLQSIDVNSCDAPSWRYLLVDAILPEALSRRGPSIDRSEQQRRDVEAMPLLEKILHGSDLRVLSRASSRLAELLPSGNPATLLRFSFFLLREAARHPRSSARRLAQRHVGDLRAMLDCIPCGAPQTALSFWIDQVSAYLTSDDVLAMSSERLRYHASMSEKSGRYLDALIYQSRLSQQGYDIHWSARLSDLETDEICKIQMVDAPVGSPSMAVVVSGRTRVSLLDLERGAPMTMIRGGRICDSLPLPAAVQPLAVLAWRNAAGIRIIISWSSPPGDTSMEQRGGTTVFELTFRESSWHVAETTLYHDSMDLSRTSRECHALCLLSGDDDLVLTGFGGPFDCLGLLSCRDGWTLRSFPMDQRTEDALEGLRRGEDICALSSVRSPDHPGRFIATLGSSWGNLWLTEIEVDETGTPTCRASPSRHRLPGSITTLLSWSSEGGASLCCAVGTAAGQLFALAVSLPCEARADGAGARWSLLWGDLARGRIKTMQIWRTDVEAAQMIMIAATDEGHVRLYTLKGGEPDHYARSGSTLGPRTDSLHLGEGLLAIAIADRTARFLAATRGNQLIGAQLCFRGCTPEEREDRRTLEHLFFRVVQQLDDIRHAADPRQLVIDEPPSRWALDFCDMIPADRGCLTHYLARQRVISTANIDFPRPRAPELMVERARICVLLRAYVQERLARCASSNEDALRSAQELTAWVTRYAWIELPSSPEQAAFEVRLTAFNELCCIGLLRLVASEQATLHQSSIAGDLRSSLQGLLRADELTVHVEAHRTIVRVLGEARALMEAGPESMDALFPGGLSSIEWMIQPLMEYSRQHFSTMVQDFAPEVCCSAAVWLQVLSLFPREALVLCDRLVSTGIAPDLLKLIAERAVQAGQPSIAASIDILTMARALPANFSCASVDHRLHEMADWSDLRRRFLDAYTPSRKQARPWEGILSSWRYGCPVVSGDVYLAREYEEFYKDLRDLWSVNSAKALASLLSCRNDTLWASTHDRRSMGECKRCLAELLHVAQEVIKLRGAPHKQRRAIDETIRKLRRGREVYTPQCIISLGILAWWSKRCTTTHEPFYPRHRRRRMRHHIRNDSASRLLDMDVTSDPVATKRGE